MADEVHTSYVKRNYATTDEVVLGETPTTRLVFAPAIHPGGVRGRLCRQKRSTDGSWKTLNEVNFQSVAADCGIAVELDTAATKVLFEKLAALYRVQAQGVEQGENDYIVARAAEVLLPDDPAKKRAIQELLNGEYSEQFWRELADQNPGLANRLAAGQIQLARQDAIKKFEESLVQHADDEDYWQRFFEQHPWMLQAAFSAAVFKLGGETYVGGKRALGRQGQGGVATDFLFSDDSTKSFAVVEIKKPGTRLLGSIYRGERDTDHDQEVYAVSDQLSGAVIQTRNQISVAIEDFQSVLGKTFEDLNRVHPKGVLVAGVSESLSERQRASFNFFRQGLYSLTVITFDELLRRLAILYDVELAETSEASSSDRGQA